jgi:hypothetical protein
VARARVAPQSSVELTLFCRRVRAMLVAPKKGKKSDKTRRNDNQSDYRKLLAGCVARLLCARLSAERC